jgi:histidine ammonia-lyase
MGWGAARKLATIIENVRRVLAIEIMCAVQAIEYRSPLKPAPATAQVCEAVRAQVPPLEGDRALSGDIATIADMIEHGEISGPA